MTFLIIFLIVLPIPILADSPISYWKLNDNVLDTQLLNNGTRFNFTDGYIAGKIGNALTFNKTYEQFVDFGNDTSLDFGLDNFSIELWIKTNTSTQDMIGKINYLVDGGWLLSISSGNIIFDVYDTQGHYYDNLQTSGLNIADNEWHHIIAVKTEQKGSIYIDGILKKNVTASSTVDNTSNTYHLAIGCGAEDDDYNCDTVYSNGYLNGTLDNIRIWNRALNDTEILSLYTSDALPSIHATSIILMINNTESNFTTSVFSGYMNATINVTGIPIKLQVNYNGDSILTTSPEFTSINMNIEDLNSYCVDGVCTHGLYEIIAFWSGNATYTSSYTTYYIDYEEPYYLASRNYCIDENYINETTVFYLNGALSTYAFVRYCDSGCDNITNICNPLVYEQNIGNFVIIIIIIVFFIFIYAWAKRRR